MAGDKRTGPQDTTPEARINNVKATTTALDTASVATPMRRRREAARRLPILAGGDRDPLDKLRLPITRRPCARAVIGLDGQWHPCCGRGAA
jgi:hypothetical protein